jgi:deoxycytidylate deaminase
VAKRSRLLDTARRILQHTADPGGQRHCALAYRGSSLLAIGFNSYRCTHPIQSSFARRTSPNRNYLHAEIDALLRSRGATLLVVARINKKGQLVNSKPCIVCQAAINTYDIKKVIHS